MSTIPVEQVMAIVLVQFTEAYAGPPQAHSWFIDNGPDAGLFRTVAALTAAQASRSIVDGGTTVAAHVEHLRWSLALFNAIVRGEQPEIRWTESWTVRTVDQEAWEHLQAELRREYETLRTSFAAHAVALKPEWLPPTMAVVPHAAYHLGAIRQMIQVIKS